MGAGVAIASIAAGEVAAISLLSTQMPPVSAQPSPSQGAGDLSDLYCVEGFPGFVGDHHIGLEKLLGLMQSEGVFLLRSSYTGPFSGPDGLIAPDDVVLVKVNSQWGERGGTNTDLVKGLIGIIISHPDGYRGEIVVADNGQGRGRFDWSYANAEDTSQSIHDVVNSFGDPKVTMFLWDTIRGSRTEEYDQGAANDGYVHENAADPLTGMRFNYPKFKTSSGTYISLKKGIWDPDARSYSNDKLKLINFPVLKSHSGAGVTACIKHYMGVVSQSMQDNHPYIWNGGLAAEMANVRFPVLNILDAIYINPNPTESGNAGPATSYDRAMKANRIIAGFDPVAIDYYASKDILVPAAKSLGYTSYSSLNPDTPNGTFHNYLNNSQIALLAAGIHATTDPTKLSIHTLNQPSLQFGSAASALLNAPAKTVYFIFPDGNHAHPKPAGVGYASVTDWTALGYVYGSLANMPQITVLDTDSTYVDQTTGAPKLSGSIIVLFGGPLVNSVVHYYEANRIAPLWWSLEGGWTSGTEYYRTRAGDVAATMPLTDLSAGSADIMLVEAFTDANNNTVLIFSGFGWQGTFTSGFYFKTVSCQDGNLAGLTHSWYFYSWTDKNGNGFVEDYEVNPIPTNQGN